MSMAQKRPGRRRPSGWILPMLASSLAFNMLVLGLAGTVMWRVRITPSRTHVVSPTFLGYASTLSAERHKQLRDLTARERKEVWPFRRQVRAARQETVKALSAAAFDREQFLAAHAQQMEARNRARPAFLKLYIAIAEALTPAERRGFVEWRSSRRAATRNVLDTDNTSKR